MGDCLVVWCLVDAFLEVVDVYASDGCGDESLSEGGWGEGVPFPVFVLDDVPELFVFGEVEVVATEYEVVDDAFIAEDGADDVLFGLFVVAACHGLADLSACFFEAFLFSVCSPCLFEFDFLLHG